jgi:hypothetical protein
LERKIRDNHQTLGALLAAALISHSRPNGRPARRPNSIPSTAIATAPAGPLMTLVQVLKKCCRTREEEENGTRGLAKQQSPLIVMYNKIEEREATDTSRNI